MACGSLFVTGTAALVGQDSMACVVGGSFATAAGDTCFRWRGASESVTAAPCRQRCVWHPPSPDKMRRRTGSRATSCAVPLVLEQRRSKTGAAKRRQVLRRGCRATAEPGS